MLARSLHLLHYRRAAGIVAHAALFPGNRSYSNNRNDSDDKQIQVAAQQPRAGFSPLDLTAKLESVLAKTLKIIDSKFAVPPPPPAIPLPEEGKNRSLDLLKSALTLGFDDDHTKSELTHKPAPTTRIPVQSQHNAAQAKLKPSASSLLHVYSVNVQKRLSQDLGEAEGRLRATDLAAKTLIGLADLRDALDAQDIALLPRDLRFQHVLRELGEPFYLSDRGLVASLAAAERLQLESLARLLVTLEKELLQRLGRRDSRGVVGIYTMLTADKVFRPLIAEWCAAAVISKQNEGPIKVNAADRAFLELYIELSRGHKAYVSSDISAIED